VVESITVALVARERGDCGLRVAVMTTSSNSDAMATVVANRVIKERKAGSNLTFT